MAKEQVHDVFESVAAQYDAANDRISFGMHHCWKKALVDRAVASAAASSPGMILDVCCGTGDIVERIAWENPGMLAVGIDFSESMLDIAHERCANLENAMLIQGDALALPFDDSTFDASVVSFGLRNLPDYEAALREMKRVTRSGGVVACLDASVPDNGFVQPFYQFYYRNIMTYLGGGAEKRPEYEYLYQSTQDFLRKNELEGLFGAVGLEYVTVRSFVFGAAALHVGVVPYKAA